MIDVTLRGFIASDVQSTPENHSQEATASFMMGSTGRAFNPATDSPPNRPTQWFTVKLTGKLATNAAASLRKGDRILAFGPFTHRQWESHGRIRSELALEAISVGHDLTWGTSTLTNT
ncbi:single-stranded DNA-binding protein [Arthrobacter sp. Rue61a]|uniref:single-stranded DNA-binding protein n=1 Tax=Arthrobacter sp. Rue61a TaxID=1118963 RepID=UPI000150AE63|nr:single-stranded DNA-binding protein [Arthrobacter sp. Rue61a]AFR34546.1 putative single-strand DNA binding protein [Arthrobacter sp. Rue61a]